MLQEKHVATIIFLPGNHLVFFLARSLQDILYLVGSFIFSRRLARYCKLMILQVLQVKYLQDLQYFLQDGFLTNNSDYLI